MFTIIDGQTICMTRGDAVSFSVSASLGEEQNYIFQRGDVVCFRVFERKNCCNILLSKTFNATEGEESVSINLDSEDTKFEQCINKPTDFWYEVELNPDTNPQTIIGYDEATGEKIFRLYPEGCECN